MVGPSITSITASHLTPPKPKPLYMLFALVCDLVRSVLLVVVEFVRLFVLPREVPKTEGCVFYEGTVMHSRNAPAKHSFAYPVRYCLVDVSDKPASLYVASLLAAGNRMSAAEARKLSGCDGRVRALLLPESAGYEQNPICVYYCDDAAGELKCCIAEVTNTPWGDRVAFPFAPSGDTLPKPLHVSPLQDMLSSWGLRASPPAERINVRVDVTAHPQLGDFFVATLDLRRVGPNRVGDADAWAFLMPHRVAWWIYAHAATLILRKGLAFYGHPKSVAGEDYRLAPARAAAQQGWPACPVLAADDSGRRPFVWHDATEAPWD